MRTQLQVRSDALIAALATRQHGVVAHGQLIEIGLSVQAIGRRLRSGRLHRVYRGVYAVGHRRLTREGRWMAAVLAGGEGAVLSHLSAAARWRILENRAKPEVTVPRMRRSRPDLRFRVATLLPDEVTTVDGIPITTVPRTLLDLAAVVDAHRLERAFNEAEYRRLDDALSVADVLERHPSRRGSASLRALLEEVAHDQGITRRELEHRFLAFVDETGLPRPRRNAAIEIEPGRWIEGDCVWPEACLIVELDSRAAHGTRSRFESDRERDRLLAVARWTVVRVTWRQLHRHPRGLAADLRALLTRRYRAET